jgi:hypothetical protein
VTLPADELAFLCSALRQLTPDARPVFLARMVEHLQAIADYDVGDVDRALRAAWTGLWTPTSDNAVWPGRWARDAPRFERASKRAW